MNSERYKQIIDEVYENYTLNTPKSHVAGSDSDPMKLSMDWKGKNDYSSGYPILERLSKESFINKIKTDNNFSEKWGLHIEERELSLGKRNQIGNFDYAMCDDSLIYPTMEDDRKKYKELFDKENIPTKVITLTYNNETIESYE